MARDSDSIRSRGPPSGLVTRVEALDISTDWPRYEKGRRGESDLSRKETHGGHHGSTR